MTIPQDLHPFAQYHFHEVARWCKPFGYSLHCLPLSLAVPGVAPYIRFLQEACAGSGWLEVVADTTRGTGNLRRFWLFTNRCAWDVPRSHIHLCPHAVKQPQL